MLDALIDMIVCAILVVVIVDDLRNFRIRNGWVIALAALFLLRDGGMSWAWHGLFGAAAFALMFGAFSLGLVGAGDAKLLAAACLWVGPEQSVAFALALFVATLMYSAGAKQGFLPSRRVGGRSIIPFGPGIAGAWIAVIAFNTLDAA